MTCPTCSGPLAMLFTSSYCPACDAREAASPEPVTVVVTGTQTWTFEPLQIGWMRLVVPVICNHPGYQGTFIIPPDDEDGE